MLITASQHQASVRDQCNLLLSRTSRNSGTCAHMTPQPRARDTSQYDQIVPCLVTVRLHVSRAIPSSSSNRIARTVNSRWAIDFADTAAARNRPSSASASSRRRAPEEAFPWRVDRQSRRGPPVISLSAERIVATLPVAFLREEVARQGPMCARDGELFFAL